MPLAKDPLTLVPLMNARNEFEGATIVEALRAHGFAAVVHGTSAMMLQAYTASTMPVRVMIPREQREAAAAALEEIRAEAKSIDWSEVSGDVEPVGPGELCCENCGYDLVGLPAGTVCPECGGGEDEM